MRKTILIVDDDSGLRQALRSVLEDRGYHVVTAENGEAALEGLKKGEPPAVVLLDLRMPRVNGWDFLARRRADASLPPVPVVVLSGYSNGPERDSALPVNAYIRKPINWDELFAEIERVCGT